MSQFDYNSTILSPKMLATSGQNTAKSKGQAAAEGGGGGGSWFEALAESWGQAMDKQAAKIVALSNELKGLNETIEAGTGPMADEAAQDLADLTGKTDQPSVLIQLTAESQRFGFMSTSANTSMSSTAEGQQKLASKS
jgi:hypothetical protein